MANEIVNLYKCAEDLQVPVKWLKEAAFSGKIPCLKFGKRDIRFNLDAVRQALANIAAREKKRDLRATILSGGSNAKR